ncbi:MAG: hypothetical protein ACON40_11205 [Ilumatobacteraceae bacterium]
MSSKSLTRSRWAAIGAAVAVTLGGGGLIGVSAASGDASSLKTVTPTRIMDTRQRTDGRVSGETVALQVTGEITTYTSSGTAAATVVPAGANAVSMNLTVTGGERNQGYGFVTAFPCTAVTDSVPNASTLNFVEGVDVANSTVVPLGATGMICLNVYGSAHVIIDANGYYETAASGAGAVDAYTKSESDSKYFTKLDGLMKADVSDAFPRNPVVMAYGNTLFSGLATNELVNQGLIPTAGRATTYSGDADGENYVMPMIGPMGAGTDNHEYSPYDVEVCFGSLMGTAKIGLRTSGDTPGSVFIGVTKEVSVLPASGCVTVEIGEDDLIPYLNDNRMNAFLLHLEVEGAGSEVIVFSVEATWYDQFNNPR